MQIDEVCIFRCDCTQIQCIECGDGFIHLSKMGSKTINKQYSSSQDCVLGLKVFRLPSKVRKYDRIIYCSVSHLTLFLYPGLNVQKYSLIGMKLTTTT